MSKISKNKLFVISLKNVLIILILFFAIILLFNVEIVEPILFLITGLLIVLSLVEVRHILKSKIILILLIANFISIVFTLLQYNGTGAGLLLFDLILTLIIFNNLKISNDLYKIIHLGFFIAIFLFCISFNISTISTGYISSGFGSLNSNSYGVLMLALFMHGSCIIDKMKNSLIRFSIYFVLFSYCLFNIWISKSRLSLLSFFIFLILIIWRKNSINSSKYRNIILWILGMSFILPIIYINFSSQYPNFILFGKNLFSGRELIWNDAFNYIKQYFVFGSGTTFKLNAGINILTDVTHNMMIGILKGFGIIPTITTFFFFYSKKRIESDDNIDKISQFAVISFLILTIGENLITDSRLCFIFLSFLLMNFKEDSNFEEKDKILIK